MSTRKFSLIIAGLIWVLVGIRIGYRSFFWLETYYNPPSWPLIFVLLSVAIGFLKATKVLRKSVERGIKNTDKIGDSFINYITGWLRLYGAKGVIVVALMIGLGYVLRYFKAAGFDPYDTFGFLYLAVSLGLIGASTYYFTAASKIDK